MATPKKSQQERVNELVESIKQGVADVFKSGRFEEYLRTMSRFYTYSFNNQILIQRQYPGATFVAGLKQWGDRFERHVKKGEKGIAILIPATKKFFENRVKLNEKGEAILGPDGSPEMEKVERKRLVFKVGRVFDVSQTEGKELPRLVDPLEGAVENFDGLIEALGNLSPAPISFGPVPGTAQGYFQPATNEIVVREGISEEQALKTTIHEVVHALAYQDREGGKRTYSYDVEEVLVESTAFVVCDHLGIDTSSYSFAYIATWGGSKTSEELTELLKDIQKYSKQLIVGLEEQLSPENAADEEPEHAQEQQIVAETEQELEKQNSATATFMTDEQIATQLALLEQGEASSEGPNMREEVMQAQSSVARVQVHEPVLANERGE